MIAWVAMVSYVLFRLWNLLSAHLQVLPAITWWQAVYFLMNCGLVDLMQAAGAEQRNRAEKLILEHEMGELFKVIALGRGFDEPLLGFTRGDRSHRL